MPKIQTTPVYRTVDTAIKKGYTTVSAQGSSRSGKTYNIMLFLCVYCMNRPLTTVSVVRETLTSIRRSVFRDFQENMLNLGLWDDRCWKKTDFIYYFENGSWIEFFGADNEQKLRGSKREILYVNEGNELTFIEWQQLQMRTTLFSIIDYNPSFTDDHWICQLNKETTTFHFITTYKQNPFLEEKVVKEIESLKQKNPSLWRVYGEGLQAIVEGLVFENTEIIDSIPKWVKKKGWLGMDLGYSSDPTAIVEVWFHNNTLYIDEVCYQTHMLTSDIIRTLKAHTEETGRKWKVISESADPRLIDEIYNAGIDIHAVRKYPGSILAGIQKMQEMKIKITKRSTNARKEFKNYTYRQDKEGHWLNEPIDAFNHCFVGDTLVKTLIGDTRIDTIKEGDYILTPNGFMPVGKVFVHRHEKIYNVRLDFGSFSAVISATPNHLFKTTEGWKKLSELQAEDVLYLHNSLIGKHLSLTNTAKSHIAHEAALVGVQLISEEYADVYDLHVDYCHEYFANGVLVHNCIDSIRYVVLEEILGGYGNGMTASEILDMFG